MAGIALRKMLAIGISIHWPTRAICPRRPFLGLYGTSATLMRAHMIIPSEANVSMSLITRGTLYASTVSRKPGFIIPGMNPVKVIRIGPVAQKKLFFRNE